jgi:hypothetical protein
MSRKVNIEITDSHRRIYSKLLTLNKKSKGGLGFHYKNKSSLNILKELEKLGYVEYKYKQSETRVYKHVNEIIYYLFYESTGKKMTNKKLPTKPISRIYDEDDIELILVRRKVELEYGWDDTILINDKESDVYKTKFNNYYIKFEDRMYKIINDLDFQYVKYSKFWTLPELKRTRVNKIKELFPEF